MAENTEPTRKWGEGALAAYGRQGWEELRRAAPYGDSPIAAPTDFGMPGMATQGEIAKAREETSLSQQESVLEKYANEPEIGRDDRDDRGIDR